MKDAIELLLKFGYHLMFLALQFICFYIIINYNQEQKSIFVNSTSILSRNVNGRVDKFNSFVRLKEENDSLQNENSKMMLKFVEYNINYSSINDTIDADSAKYLIQGVDICNSTFNQRNNYLTLCQGSINGLKEDDGVISKNGIVGIIKKVGEKFSIVMSILHSQTSISCSILRNVRKGTNSSGVLIWKGGNPKICYLEAIPKHLNVFENDTIITSGYSTIFPKGLQVGKVKEVTLEKGSNTYTIEVELFNDPSSWDAIYIIRNRLGNEQKELEKSVIKDE
jgi:rod shape-determining protein MreC